MKKPSLPFKYPAKLLCGEAVQDAGRACGGAAQVEAVPLGLRVGGLAGAVLEAVGAALHHAGGCDERERAADAGLEAVGDEVVAGCVSCGL